ncbi:MAG TPA: lyase family protein [Anaerolineales bacterium]|nr:lyase family protein [Anaerolineales bacterium]
MTNIKLGLLAPKPADTIVEVCNDILTGELFDEFVVDVIQGEAGTSTNMNANEVITIRALEHLGLPKGRYDVLHPLNHASLSQYTNDV